MSRPEQTLLEKTLLNEKRLRQTIDEFYRRASDPKHTVYSAFVHASGWLVSTVVFGALVGYFLTERKWGALIAVIAVGLGGGTLLQYRRVVTGVFTWLGVAYGCELFLDRYKSLGQSVTDLRQKQRELQSQEQRMSNVLDHLDEAIKWSCKAMVSEGKDLALWTRRSMLACMRFFSSLGQKDEKPAPRAGLLVRSLEKANALIPLIVYVPDNDSYVSQSEFDITKDFSGMLLSEFEKNSGAPDFQTFLTDWIPDTHEHLHRERKARFRFVEDHHHRQVNSIFGNVVYMRNDGQLVTQGILNIDAAEARGVDADVLRMTRAQQRPVFRVLNMLLQLATEDRKLFNAIYENSEYGE